MSDDLVMYVIVNTSLKMRCGKIASQVAHAVLAVEHAMRNKSSTYQLKLREWKNSGETIVILKTDSECLLHLINEYYDITYPIYDAGRTQVNHGDLTVVGIDIFNKNNIPMVIKKMKLL